MGLCGGYLDLVLVVLKKHFWSDLGHYESGRDFPWSIPAVHVVLLLIPAVLMAAVVRLRPGHVSLRTASWLFATLAIWAALLRAPLYGVSSLLLAAGLGRPISGAVAACVVRHPGRARHGLAGLLGALIVMAALSSGRQAIREHSAVAGLPAPPPGARNVVLIIWDTVRAYNTSLQGYPRDTTPNLVRWARTGIRYDLPMAPAPWTFPSHSCFFTGEWPYTLNSHRNTTLDAPKPTLAEYLASRGYQTAGFAANTNYCSYETGLDRGFTHYEDYPLTLLSLLGRTVPGSWILENIFSSGNFYDRKWIRLQSRDARGINDAFLDWLHRGRRQERPFFAFLNYFDAHDPYVPPAGYAGRFGIRPRTRRDYQFLTDFAHLKTTIAARDVVMARDCYDDCIAFLDDQLERLLAELQRQGLLDRTLVIITSDHGEGFGNHGAFGHGGNLFLDQIAVPLVILSPGAASGRIVADPVSLRDLPATVVDQLGLADGSPFPGHSLGSLWRSTPGQPPPEVTPAFSEIAHATAFQPQAPNGLGGRGFQMSLVALGRHYIRDSTGSERIYDLGRDPFETVNLTGSAQGDQVVDTFRRMLLKLLTDNPGSIEVENAYLRPYRQWLRSVVVQSPAPREAMSALGERSHKKRRE
jgi:arylsulfatase A-like enzyme